MIIKEFYLRHKLDFEFKNFSFNNSIQYLYSSFNAKGKTTFLRAILYSLGFNIPSTKKVDFNDYEFKIEVSNATEEFIIKRQGNIVYINENEYTYPTDYLKVLGIVYGFSNTDIINNILGVSYFDQEKGWTLLNRGKIVGDIGFSIESFLRGLNETNVHDLQFKVKRISDEIKKYRLMMDISKYQNEVSRIENPTNGSSFDEDLEMRIAILNNKINLINKQILEIKGILHSNSKFANYIESLGLQVLLDGKEYIITKNDLLNFKDNETICQLKIRELLLEKEELNKEVKYLESQRKEPVLIEIESIVDKFDKSLKGFILDPITINNIIDGLEKERAQLNNLIKERTTVNNKYIAIMSQYLKKYWQKLDIEIDYADNYIFTHDLKSLSGAVLYKMIIAYKLSYIKTLQDKTNETYPIFIDSPSGREVKEDVIKKALSLIRTELPNNQLFICSIFKFDLFELDSHNTIDFDDLCAFDRKSLIS